MASFSNFKTVNRIKFKIYNEKSLILLLLIISVITVFIILMNLPSDIQRSSKKDIENVFIPKVYQNIKHEDNHQHAAPPIYKDDEMKQEEKPSIKIIEGSVEAKREQIKKMALFGWSNYEKYAWGENELKPISKTGHSAGIFGTTPTKLGATIVDGLDTMYMMGYMEEYKRGREWIIKNFNIEVNSDVSVFEVNIRFIGGLLSLYTLTNDKVFLDKAELVATKLLPAFETETGIPYAIVNPITKKVKNYNWATGSCSILAEFGTLSLEFQYLSDLTGNKIFAQKIENIFKVLNKIDKEYGLYYNYLNQHSGKWCMKHASIGALADSFYEYLLKLWIYKNKNDVNLLNMYLNAMKAVQEQLMDKTASNLTYFGEFKSNRLDKKMDHLACFSGGLMALTSFTVDSLSDVQKHDYLDIGKRITHTCHESYIRTATHLGPEAFHFERANQEAVAIKNDEKYYILRPEVIESYFYMWRLTKNQKYRDWAWDAAQALEKNCRTENGYSGIKDVYDTSSSKDDVQQSFLFAETFKYLFLIFSDDDVLPLDKYVLNTEAHLFLINKKY